MIQIWGVVEIWVVHSGSLLELVYGVWTCTPKSCCLDNSGTMFHTQQPQLDQFRIKKKKNEVRVSIKIGLSKNLQNSDQFYVILIHRRLFIEMGL